jgi:hypothetical protein
MMEFLDVAKLLTLAVFELLRKFLADLGQPLATLAVVFLSVLALVVLRAVLFDLMQLTRFGAAIVRLLRSIFRLVFAPINFVFRYRHWMRGFEYRQGQLMRASHGAASSLFAALVGWNFLQTHNLSQPVLVVLAVPVVWGVVVFIDGARKSRGDFDWYLGGNRALLKATVGGVALFLLPAGFWLNVLIAWTWAKTFASWLLAGVLPSTLELWAWGEALALAAAWIIAFWCLATGATKFLLLLRGRRSSNPLPIKPPRPPARFSTPDEAMQAMQGHGGRRTSLDDRAF